MSNRAIIEKELTQGVVPIGTPKAYQYDQAFVESAVATVQQGLEDITAKVEEEKADIEGFAESEMASYANAAAQSAIQAGSIATQLTDVYNDAIEQGTVIAPIVDDTLTISGAAADAFVTGNMIDVARMNMTWEQGAIGLYTGEDAPSVVRCRTIGFLPVKSGNTITFPEGYSGAQFYYDSDYTFQGYSGWSNSITINHNYPIIRLAVRNSDDTTIIPSDFSNYITDIRIVTDDSLTLPQKPADAKKVGTLFAEVKTELEKGIKSTNYNFEFGGFDPDGSDVDNTIRIRTDFIPTYVNQFNSNIVFESNGNYNIGVFRFYNDSLEFVAQVPATSINYAPNQKIELPLLEDYKYFRFSFKKSDDADFTNEELASARLTTYYYNYALLNTQNPWYGLKYAALGDSITYGFIPRNYTGYPGQLKSFARITAKKLGMTFVNYGISGSTLAYVSNRNPMCRRYNDLPNDADLITVMGGTNDVRNGVTLGTMADRDDSTYYGALHVVLGGLYKKYMIDQGTTIGKKKTIVALTPIKLLEASSSSDPTGEGTLVDLEPWVEAVKKVSAFYSIPCFDFYDLSGINPHLDRTIHGTEEGYTGYYNPYITDGTHPTQEGAEIMAKAFIGFLKSIR